MWKSFFLSKHKYMKQILFKILLFQKRVFNVLLLRFCKFIEKDTGFFSSISSSLCDLPLSLNNISWAGKIVCLFESRVKSYSKPAPGSIVVPINTVMVRQWGSFLFLHPVVCILSCFKHSSTCSFLLIMMSPCLSLLCFLSFSIVFLCRNTFSKAAYHLCVPSLTFAMSTDYIDQRHLQKQ